MSKHLSESRRLFLKRVGLLSGLGAASSWALGLNTLCEAAVPNANDYKALVCVFLFGGNDYANTLVPYDQENYSVYQKVRDSIALNRDQLGATRLKPKVALPNGFEFALAPELAPIKPLFDSGDMAVQLNIGPLIEPTNFKTFNQHSVQLPRKLFSHNDQQAAWQSDQLSSAQTGWGGRIGDLLESSNRLQSLSCISLHGSALLLSGSNAFAYQMTPEGAVPFRSLKKPLYGNPSGSEAVRSMLGQNKSHWMQSAYLDICQRSIDLEQTVNTAMDALGDFNTAAPNDNKLAGQLRRVARMIGSHKTLGLKRQVFLVGLGGFDTHSDLGTRHPELMKELGGALQDFQACLGELKVQDKVCTFTASDFGRTLSANGDGTDHGWGGHHFIVGGSLSGGQFFGQAEETALTGPQYTDRGRLIPTTSIDQMIASLGTWFGVGQSDLKLVAPNIPAFSTQLPSYFG